MCLSGLPSQFVGEQQSGHGSCESESEGTGGSGEPPDEADEQPGDPIVMWFPVLAANVFDSGQAPGDEGGERNRGEHLPGDPPG